jgi:hypothetical protein
MQLKKKIRAGVAALVIGVTGSVAFAIPAHTGAEMNGYFPWVKGCDADQALVHSTGIWDKYGRYVGKVELWWSNRCVTNWVRVAPNNPNGMGLAATISNYSGSSSATAKDYSFGYSGMLYSPSSNSCVNSDVSVSAGPWSNTYNDRAPRYRICRWAVLRSMAFRR